MRPATRSRWPFAAESAALLALLPRVRGHISVSRPGPGDEPGRDFDSTGRLSADLFPALELPRDADAYLCGPAAFLTAVTAAPVAAPVPQPPDGPPGDGALVSFARSDVTVPWRGTYGSLLDLAEACDVPTRWSCRTGVCPSCESGLLSGEVEYSPEPVDDPAVGNVLICSARSRRPGPPSALSSPITRRSGARP